MFELGVDCGAVFPASAGMIPLCTLTVWAAASVPRKRGDDPASDGVLSLPVDVFPASAGMIPG